MVEFGKMIQFSYSTIEPTYIKKYKEAGKTIKKEYINLEIILGQCDKKLEGNQRKKVC